MELIEVRDAQEGLNQNRIESLYWEINEHVPLHPGTRSWEVSRQSVFTEKVIGQGSYGQVAQGRASNLPSTEGTITVAIKMLKGINERFSFH